MKKKNNSTSLKKENIVKIIQNIVFISSIISFIVFIVNLILIITNFVNYKYLISYYTKLHNYMEFIRKDSMIFLVLFFLIFSKILEIYKIEPKIINNVFFNNKNKKIGYHLLLIQILLLFNILITSFICGLTESCNCNYGTYINGERLIFNQFNLYVEFSKYVFFYFLFFIYTLGVFQGLSNKKKKDKN
jgi:hypothetical protein